MSRIIRTAAQPPTRMADRRREGLSRLLALPEPTQWAARGTLRLAVS